MKQRLIIIYQIIIIIKFINYLQVSVKLYGYFN